MLQVDLFQELRESLWQQAHGGLTSRAAPGALAVQEEPFAFAWLRLTKALRGIAAAAPGVSALREAERLSAVVEQVNTGLGLQGGPPPKPLLWRLGGHPRSPPSLDLWHAASQLQLLCDATRLPPSGDFGDSATVAGLISRMRAGRLEGDEDMHAVGPDGERDASKDELAAVAAALSSDWGLRRALLEGSGLFAMAAALAAGRKDRLAAGRLDGVSPGDAAQATSEVVSTLQQRVENAVEQVQLPYHPRILVGCCLGGNMEMFELQMQSRNKCSMASQALARLGDERSVIRNATPLLDKPLDSGVLPEVFPAQLMVNNTIQSLQLELLPFQVQCFQCWAAVSSAHGTPVLTTLC